MPILNYTTEVSPERTVAEITKLLVTKGATSVTSDYQDDGRVRAVSFTMKVGGIPCRFMLPSNVAGVFKVLLKEKPFNPSRHKGGPGAYQRKVAARAEWVAWRIMKDWVAAQMALIESGQGEAAQVFMPYAMADAKRTVYELFVENNQKQLGSGAQS